jgi:drug/metabolite transporter (DMT)-like permease
MTVALGLSAALLMAVSILTREPNRRDTLRRGAPWALLCGLCNGGVNLLVLRLNGVLPASVMFPTMSVGQIILICLYAKFVCRERHTKGQWAGFAVGMAAVLLLNLA